MDPPMLSVLLLTVIVGLVVNVTSRRSIGREN